MYTIYYTLYTCCTFTCPLPIFCICFYFSFLLPSLILRKKIIFPPHNFSTDGFWLSEIIILNLKPGKIKVWSMPNLLCPHHFFLFSFSYQDFRLQSGVMLIPKRGQSYDAATFLSTLQEAIPLHKSVPSNHTNIYIYSCTYKTYLYMYTHISYMHTHT